jgi:hypothetical protein
MKDSIDLMQDAGCTGPMPDGSPCHACRIFEALMEAEAALGNDDNLDDARCAAALYQVAAYFVAGLEDDRALAFVTALYALSRTRRAEMEAGDDGPLAHTEGNA